MNSVIKTFLLIFILGMGFNSCNQNEIDGIIIGHTLSENQSLSENRELRQLIQQTLNHDEKALAKLSNYWCGDGAGCYDLGIIITQIIYRIGEPDFIKIVAKLDYKEKFGLKGLISAGLAYGDHTGDGRSDNKRIENEFPELLSLLRTKRENE